MLTEEQFHKLTPHEQWAVVVQCKEQFQHEGGVAMLLKLKARVLELEAATKSGQMTVGFALARLALDFCTGALVPDAGVLKQHAEDRMALVEQLKAARQQLEQAKAARAVLVADLAETAEQAKANAQTVGRVRDLLPEDRRVWKSWHFDLNAALGM